MLDTQFFSEIKQLRQELNKINASSQLLPKLVEEMAKTNNFLAEFGKAIQEWAGKTESEGKNK